MAEIVLDISANTTKNDNSYALKLIQAIKKIDKKKHYIVFKAQLFTSAGANIVMIPEHFDYIYNICKDFGYRCTASVFDKKSLNSLLQYKTPFIKIACREDIYPLIGEIPRRKTVYVSYEVTCQELYKNQKNLACIPKYPATVKDYEELFSPKELMLGISDHTPNLDLFKKYKPKIYECHYALEDSTGLDVEAGVCKTPSQLVEILS